MNATNLMLATIAANFLAAVAAKANNDLSPSIVKALEAQKVELQPSGLIHATGITPGNIVQLLQSDNNRADGKSDFSGQKLDANMVFIVTGVKFGYVDSTATDVAGALYDSDRENLPAAIVNSIFEIHQNGKLKFRIPVSRLLTQVNADSQRGDLYELPGLIALNGDTETELTLKMPSGVTLTVTDNAYVKVEFQGFATRIRS